MIIKVFLTATNAIMPIVLLSLLGYILKRIGLFTPEFVRIGNRFVFINLGKLTFLPEYHPFVHDEVEDAREA